MKTPLFKGAGVAIVTPMNADGTINYKRLGELIDYQIKWCTDAIIICGTTGEASTLSDEEHIETIKFAVEHTNKRVPVIAGTGSNCTEYSVHLSKKAEEVGADGVLLVTPYYNKTTPQGLLVHFGEVAKAINIPIILYNIPSRTGMNIDIYTLKELAKIDNIIAIKEASGNIKYATDIIYECGDMIDIYSGNDDMIVPIMSIGGIGAISVLSNLLPFETHKIVEFCLENNFHDAKVAQMQYLDLINALFMEVNPIPVKQALNFIDCDVGPCRLPLTEMTLQHKAVLRNCLIKHRLMDEL